MVKKMVVEILRGALQGVSNFLTSFFNVLGGSMNPAAVEGILALFCISIIYRIFNGGVKVPKIECKKKKRTREDDEEYEFVVVRRRK